MEKIDIVMTCWQREWMTEAFLAALRQNTKTPYRLIAIDNGSASYVNLRLTREADIYVKLDQNYGLEYAKNLGMVFVKSKYFVSTDNDILVFKYQDPDWLGRLVDLMDRHPEYGAIAPKPQILVGTGMRMFETENELVDFPHVPGYARIMRTDWVKEVGAWQDCRPGRGHEELWIGEKFREKGYKLAWANNVQCWHLFGKEDTDAWGYPKDMKPEDHGHHPVWPMPTNDRHFIWDKVGIQVQEAL